MLTVTGAEVVVDRDTHSIIMTRAFAAPCEQVFEAWTQPEHVKWWWDPSGEPLAECQIDLRPGGDFSFVSQAANGAHTFAGVYREIAPPRRLIFEAMGAMGSVLIDETDGKTLLTVKIACGSAAALEQFLKMGVDTGTAKTLDNLVAYIGAAPEWKSSAGPGA